MAKSEVRSKSGDVGDSFFGPAYIDVDEWRDEPLRHRYVHGGFESTDTRFSFYFPPAEQWSGRLLHTLEGGLGGNENTAVGPIGFAGLDLAFGLGAYLVESNQGHLGLDYTGLKGDPSILHWRASAASARYSQQVAADMYGSAPHHSYVFGGSGGALRSVHAIERAGDLYDGCVPFMHAHHYLMSDFPIAVNALRLLKPKVKEIIDATAVGGSGNPFAGLDNEQTEALVELYRAGFARRGELSLEFPLEIEGVMCWLQPEMTEVDPEYFEDFWNVPGYLGADDPKLSAEIYEQKVVVQAIPTPEELMARADELGSAVFRAMAVGVISANVVVVDLPDTSSARGATLQVVTGEAAGRELSCDGAVGDVIIAVTGPGGDARLFAGVKPGDEIFISNRKNLAQCFWSRHHMGDETKYRPNHHWTVDGKPIYPQRPHHKFMNMGPDYTYEFSGKMILVQNALDIGCWPSGGAVYHEQISKFFGDSLNDHFRLWWNDNASHLPASFLDAIAPKHPHPSTLLIDYMGSVHQAVHDLVAWVEDGIEPPPTSGYDWSEDWALTLAPTVEERKGIQPVVSATANGGVRADVKAGETVMFEANAEVPDGAGTIISAEWNFDGSGTWPVRDESLDGTAKTIHLSATHSYDKPGTYFPAVRVVSHRDGEVNDSSRALPNLGRVRVVVS